VFKERGEGNFERRGRKDDAKGAKENQKPKNKKLDLIFVFVCGCWLFSVFFASSA